MAIDPVAQGGRSHGRTLTREPGPTHTAQLVSAVHAHTNFQSIAKVVAVPHYTLKYAAYVAFYFVLYINQCTLCGKNTHTRTAPSDFHTNVRALASKSCAVHTHTQAQKSAYMHVEKRARCFRCDGGGADVHAVVVEKLTRDELPHTSTRAMCERDRRRRRRRRAFKAHTYICAHTATTTTTAARLLSPCPPAPVRATVCARARANLSSRLRRSVRGSPQRETTIRSSAGWLAGWLLHM